MDKECKHKHVTGDTVFDGDVVYRVEVCQDCGKELERYPIGELIPEVHPKAQ
jgi:hypothetical protein